MPTISSGDTAWVLISTALVALMVPGLAFFYGLDVFHSDNFYSEARNLIEIDSYTRLNGFLGFGADDRKWQVTLTGKNLTDEEDNTSGIFANQFTNIRTPLPPAEYMLNFKINY